MNINLPEEFYIIASDDLWDGELALGEQRLFTSIERVADEVCLHDENTTLKVIKINLDEGTSRDVTDQIEAINDGFKSAEDSYWEDRMDDAWLGGRL